MIARKESSSSSSSDSLNRQTLEKEDSFTMDCDESSDGIPVDNSPAGRLQFSNNLFISRRADVAGLDIGHGGASLNNDLAKEDKEMLQMEPLSAAMVNNIWTCLDVDGDDTLRVNAGWMFALSLLRSVVSRRRYPPLHVTYKVFTVALKDKREEVRLSAYSTMCQVIQLYQPSAHNRIYYLHLISSGELDQVIWEFNMKEPWEFLVNVVEECMEANTQENGSINDSKILVWSEKDQSGGQNGAWSLTLKLIAELLEMDLKNWFESLVEEDVAVDMSGANRPLVASVVWPGKMIEWCKRMEKLCTLYVAGVGGALVEQDLESVRKLTGLAAQTLQMKERTKGMSERNANKVEMAKCIAREMNRLEMSSDDLWMELYLLEPAWLSALVSSELLAKQTKKTTALAPTLGSVVDTYVNTEIDIQELDPKSSSLKSMLVTSSSKKKNAGTSQSTLVTSSSKKKNAVVNKLGETALHRLCRKGDATRILKVLSTPGIDINIQDNYGRTPLHDAVFVGAVEAVEMLVNHSEGEAVDVLAIGGDDKMSPFHEAVCNNNLEIVKIIISVAGKTGFPSIQEIMSSKTGGGDAALDLSISPEMTRLLQMSLQAENNKVVALKVVDVEKFSAVLHMAVSKYIAANCLASIYGVITNKRNDQYTLDVDKVMAGESSVPSRFKKWGIVSMKDGLKTSQFGVRPSFDIFRDDIEKAQDVRDYEKLLIPKQLAKMSSDHPIANQLKLMKITELNEEDYGTSQPNQRRSGDRRAMRGEEAGTSGTQRGKRISSRATESDSD